MIDKTARINLKTYFRFQDLESDDESSYQLPPKSMYPPQDRVPPSSPEEVSLSPSDRARMMLSPRDRAGTTARRMNRSLQDDYYDVERWDLI